MKSKDFLREAVNPQLLQYISSTPGFSMPSTNLAVFAWDDKTLSRLIKMGLNPGLELRTIRTPQKGQLGLGIVDLSNSMGAVGAIDTDGGVFVVSSIDNDADGIDARQFFRSLSNSKVRKLFSRLEDLEDLYNEKKEQADTSDSDSILDRIKKEMEDGDLSLIDDEYLDFDSEDPDEIKAEIQGTIIELKNKNKILQPKIDAFKKQSKLVKTKEEMKDLFAKTKTFRTEYDNNDSTIDALEDLLAYDKIFKPVKKKSKEGDSKQIQKQIEQWLDTLNSDFPGLDIEDAEQFIPQ